MDMGIWDEGWARMGWGGEYDKQSVCIFVIQRVRNAPATMVHTVSVGQSLRRRRKMPYVQEVEQKTMHSPMVWHWMPLHWMHSTIANQWYGTGCHCTGCIQQLYGTGCHGTGCR